MSRRKPSDKEAKEIIELKEELYDQLIDVLKDWLKEHKKTARDESVVISAMFSVLSQITIEACHNLADGEMEGIDMLKWLHNSQLKAMVIQAVKDKLAA